MTSLLLVEDHISLARALARALRQMGDMEQIVTAHTADEAVDRLKQAQVDLVLVDVSMPDRNGIELVAELHQSYPHLPCLMLSGHTAAHYVQRSLDAGARGYVAKDDLRDILEGIQRVLAGEIYVSPELRPE